MLSTVIDRVLVSLMSHHRVVLLRQQDAPRFLPIWVGPYESDAIVMALQKAETPRPMTHDLLKNTIVELGATRRRDWRFPDEFRESACAPPQAGVELSYALLRKLRRTATTDVLSEA